MRLRTRSSVVAAGLAGAIATLLVTPGPAVAATPWTTVAGDNPSPAGNVLSAVSAGSGTTWAVGFYQGPNRHDGKIMLAERWDGTQWRRVATPNVSFFDEKLMAVSASAADDAWVVGSTNQTSFATTNPIAAHWNGASWTIVPTPATTGSAKSILFGVVDLSATNAWAVGRSRDGNALVEHWDGNAWSIVPVPSAPPGGILTGVSALSPNNIWAVGTSGGQTLVLHYDGMVWQRVASPNTSASNILNGVTAVGASDVWAVGNTISTDGSGLPNKTLTLHWNGTGWSVVSSPSPAAHDVLSGVSALSGSDVWAVGYHDDTTGSIPIRVTLTEHWNGTGWTVVSSPTGAAVDTTLSGTSASAGQVWAAGDSAGKVFILRRTS